ncbi:NifU family protein [Candidatus Magnetominusculus dajiuhuensis]|uniref:NifU family protein n=1 Tax=Candidatus Magnetominusculus dajiuhuensis TaxID=3137712 RepID=UPI003B4386ED
MDNEALDKVIQKVREGLKAEGGDVEVVGLKNDVLYVRLLGSCETCPMSGLTMKNWVEKTFMDALPSIKGVKAV